MSKDNKSIVYLVIGIIFLVYGLEQYLANIFFQIPPLLKGVFNWTVSFIFILLGLYLINKGYDGLKKKDKTPKEDMKKDLEE